jgi:hypothetical protein
VDFTLVVFGFDFVVFFFVDDSVDDDDPAAPPHESHATARRFFVDDVFVEVFDDELFADDLEDDFVDVLEEVLGSAEANSPNRTFGDSRVMSDRPTAPVADRVADMLEDCR